MKISGIECQNLAVDSAFQLRCDAQPGLGLGNNVTVTATAGTGVGIGLVNFAGMYPDRPPSLSGVYIPYH